MVEEMNEETKAANIAEKEDLEVLRSVAKSFKMNDRQFKGVGVMNIGEFLSIVNDNLESRIDRMQFERCLLKDSKLRKPSKLESLMRGVGLEIDKTGKVGGKRDYDSSFQLSDSGKCWLFHHVGESLYIEYLYTPTAQDILGHGSASSMVGTSTAGASAVDDTEPRIRCSGFFNNGDSVLCGGIIGQYKYFNNEAGSMLRMIDTDYKNDIDFKWMISPDCEFGSPRPWAIFHLDCNQDEIEPGEGTKHAGLKGVSKYFCRKCQGLNKLFQCLNVRHKRSTVTSATDSFPSTALYFEDVDNNERKEEVDEEVSTIPDFSKVLCAAYMKISSLIAIKKLRPIITAGSTICGRRPTVSELEGLSYTSLNARTMQLYAAVTFATVQELKKQDVLNSASDASNKKGNNITIFTVSYCEQPGRAVSHFLSGLESISKKAEAGGKEIIEFLQSIDASGHLKKAIKRGTHTTDNASVAVATALIVASQDYGCDAHGIALARGLGISIVCGAQDGIGSLTCIQLMFDISYWWRRDQSYIDQLLMRLWNKTSRTFNEIPRSARNLPRQVNLARWTIPSESARAIRALCQLEANEEVIDYYINSFCNDEEEKNAEREHLQLKMKALNGRGISYFSVFCLCMANTKYKGFQLEREAFAYMAGAAVNPYWLLELAFLDDNGRFQIDELSFINNGPTKEQLNDGINRNGTKCYNIRAMGSFILDRLDHFDLAIIEPLRVFTAVRDQLHILTNCDSNNALYIEMVTRVKFANVKMREKFMEHVVHKFICKGSHWIPIWLVDKDTCQQCARYILSQVESEFHERTYYQEMDMEVYGLFDFKALNDSCNHTFDIQGFGNENVIDELKLIACSSIILELQGDKRNYWDIHYDFQRKFPALDYIFTKHYDSVCSSNSPIEADFSKASTLIEKDATSQTNSMYMGLYKEVIQPLEQQALALTKEESVKSGKSCVLYEEHVFDLLLQKGKDLETYRGNVPSIYKYRSVKKKVIEKEAIQDTFDLDVRRTEVTSGWAAYKAEQAIIASGHITNERERRKSSEAEGSKYEPSKDRAILIKTAEVMSFNNQLDHLKQHFEDGSIRKFSDIVYDPDAATVQPMIKNISECIKLIRRSFDLICMKDDGLVDFELKSKFDKVNDPSIKAAIGLYMVKKQVSLSTTPPDRPKRVNVYLWSEDIEAHNPHTDGEVNYLINSDAIDDDNIEEEDDTEPFLPFHADFSNYCPNL